MFAGTDILDLKDLLSMVKENLEEGFPEAVWVRAEVASIQVKGTRSSPGHCYMELCQSGPGSRSGRFAFGSAASSGFFPDSSPQGAASGTRWQEGGAVTAKVRAIAWQYAWLQISRLFRAATGGDIRPGIKILANVRVNFSEQYGLSLIIEDIDPSYTLGDAEAQRRETIARLEKENLLDAQKELPLSPVPYNLAVISSATAAGYGDFRRHLEENEYGFRFRVQLFEALMQGDGAPASIIDALGRIEAGCEDDPDHAWDAVLIMRGGGSTLDLSCFDDYSLCAAIARCSVPVFTAIGHDRDNHVADMVAWQSVKTPTALSDLFVSAFADEDERICAFGTRLRLAFTARINNCETALERMSNRIRLSAAGKVLLHISALDKLEARIRAADPRTVLGRGFTITTDADGVVRKTSAAFQAGDIINVMFPDGTLNCTVNGKRKL